MTERYAADEADIRRRVDRWADAIRNHDLDGVMSAYSPDVVSFDLDGPLQYLGVEAKKKPWQNVFTIYQRPLDYEVRDLTIALGQDVAFGHSLNRISGTLKSGKKTAFWLRWTTGFRKIGGQWLIAHEQLSVPIDPASGRAEMTLEPLAESKALHHR